MQGIENVDSEIVAAVEVVECVRVGAEAEIAAFGAGADTVVVAVHYEVAYVVEEGYIEVVIVVEEGYIEDFEVVAIHVGIVAGVVIAIVRTGAGTLPVGSVDDDELVQIHNADVIVELRLGLGVGIGIDMSVAEAGFEDPTSIEIEPKEQHNCCMTSFPDMFGKHKKTLLFWMEQVSDACLG